MDKRLLLIFSAILIGLGIMWQAQTFFGKNGVVATDALNDELMSQAERIEALEADNEALKAEIYELKNGYESLEAIARYDLGMIKEGETLFLYGDSKPSETDTHE